MVRVIFKNILKDFMQALDLYYQVAGYDSNGIPTEGKLAELGLSWIKK